MVWADTAEQLKQELTDKYVVVMDGVPELKRFAGRTGTVRTVNMNGRALVQFEAPADISWYDIDPSYLTVIDAPLPKKEEAKKPAEEKPAATKPAAKAKGGMSPLEMARQQGAAGAGGGKPAPAAEGGKKLSPLEMARQQGAAKAGGAPPAAAKPAAAPAADDGGKSSLRWNSPVNKAPPNREGGALLLPKRNRRPLRQAAVRNSPPWNSPASRVRPSRQARRKRRRQLPRMSRRPKPRRRRSPPHPRSTPPACPRSNSRGCRARSKAEPVAALPVALGPLPPGQ